MAEMRTRTNAFGPRSAPDAPVSAFPKVGPRESQALLDCLFVVEGADSLFLLRQTGLAPGDLRFHLSGLAQRGYLAPMATGSKGLRPLLRLTDEGRNAHRAVKRWRFKSAAVVLVSALSRR